MSKPDIVLRLRDPNEKTYHITCNEAAQVIERLRTENEQLKAAVCRADIKCDRLAGALTKIASWGVLWPETHEGYAVMALMTAREAVPEKEAKSAQSA